ncbi:HalOD1 output domain-containing protein [Haladaptatus salinisoli]|uniref:HalOD1 output domain-containing protein n=1 Tax=Haladaptatus salinisoli TaxID=2884876 RepID=UPI001D0B6982|nr:HalOD1 output domain-containing protein [Haladaptatus salinisoli]
MGTSDDRDSSGDERLSLRVVHAIAEYEETDPTEIRPVLYDIIDPDALDSLFEDTQNGTARASGHVAFGYGRHEVTVYSDGRIELVEKEFPESVASTKSTSNDS